MAIPVWLKAHLEATGRWDTDGIRRTISAAVCRTCGAHVLRGLDDDRCAGPATADPTPLDPAGEALALLTGRATYDLTRSGDRYQLDHRDPTVIRHHPATTGRTDVLAEHRCHTQSLPAAPSNHQPRQRSRLAGDEPPPF